MSHREPSRRLARLMMEVPEATIHTLMDFMQEPELTQPYLSKLDRTSAQFFQTQFFSKAFDNTRQQILTRLYGVLTNSVLERMFSHPRNKLNLYQAMNAGSLILINTAKNYRVGLVIAHQNLNQFDTRLRSTVMSSTTTKMVGGLSHDDASRFANEMNCDTAFLQSIRKHDDYTESACMVRNYTERPLRLTVPFGQLEDRPTNTKEGIEYLKERNCARYCGNIQDHTGHDPIDDHPNGQSGFNLDEPELI